MVLPPLRSSVGHNPNQLVKCFSLAKSSRSVPASAITVCAVSTSMPFTWAQSMPVIRDSSQRKSSVAIGNLLLISLVEFHWLPQHKQQFAAPDAAAISPERGRPADFSLVI